MIIEQMSEELGLSTKFIINLAKGASHEYKYYAVRKRGGGIRDIYHPSRRLKGLQRWLLGTVIEKWPVHVAAMAYKTGTSIFTNASCHASSRYLLRMDFTNFFPSISDTDVRKYIAERAGLFSEWSPSDVDVFCKLVCRRGALTIGAPTSPALSNAICYDLDSQLQMLCAKNEVTYSRYADDLFFSTTHRGVLANIEREVSPIISNLVVPGRLVINSSKTRHSSKRGARRVTGIVLGSDGIPHVGRKVKRSIRAQIYKYESLDRRGRARLAGMIAYVAGFDPDFVNNLISKYGLPTLQKVRNLTES